jgi:hypothetical protein
LFCMCCVARTKLLVTLLALDSSWAFGALIDSLHNPLNQNRLVVHYPMFV